MGTRNLTCVVSNERYKVANYGQWDGYPSGLGISLLKFLNENIDLNKFKEKVEKCSFIESDEISKIYEECGAEPGAQFVSMEVSDKFKNKHLHLSRDCGAEILPLIQNSENGLKLINQLNFAADSLFCEWAYVIDLDKNTFEVYEGYQKGELNENERFNFLSDKTSQYSPVKFVKSYNLDDLPTQEDFLAVLEPKEENEE